MAVGDVWQASATSPVTENSDTYTLLNDMTLTPGEAGDYLIWFSSSVKVDSVERDVFCAVFVGGTIETNSERYILEETSMTGRYGIIGTFWYATGVGATEAIEIRVKTSSASTNFDFLERTLIIRRVNSSDIFHNSHLSEQQISGAEAQLTNCTQTPGAGDYVAWFSASVHNGSTAITHARTRMFINAVAQTHTERQMCCEGSFPNTEHILASHMKIANLGASEVVEVKGYRDGSTMSIFGKALTLHKEDEGNVIEKTATDEQTVTSSTYATIPGMTDTPGAGDYLVFFSGNFSKSSGSSNTINIAIAKDSTIEAHSEREMQVDESWDSGGEWHGTIFTMAYLPNVSAGVAINARWKISASTGYLWGRTLTIIKLAGEQTLVPTGIGSLESFGATVLGRTISGITKDKDGNALGSCHCYLAEDNGDNTLTYIDYVLSNATTGAYSFIAPHGGQFLTVAWKDDTPHVFDVTDHVL